MARSAKRKARRIELLNKGSQLLEYFMRHAGPGGDTHHASRSRLGLQLRSGANVIDVHVSRLRSELEHGRSRRCCIRSAGRVPA
ncbi:winged helix-turn-helix domain-containing protein [Phenylobacterium sp. J426]|uniref:winged helix-turn-helix domain-containing protein n=1 Tax=Phenylobacterium sp. J426 TaxID=2898439 RepID=UPI0035AEA51B